jgi:lysophospholipase L1-like esterase
MVHTLSRRSVRLLATIAAGAAAVALWCGAAPARAESNGGVKVMPLGDSITEGTQVPGGYRIGLWEQLAAGGHRVDFVGSQFNGPAALGDHDHEGHPGWRIDQIDANVTTWMRTSAPRDVLLHIGTNDLLQGRQSGATNRLGTLLDRITAAAPNTDVFVATLIPIAGRDADVRAFNAAVPGLVQTRAAAGKRVHLVAMNSALTTADLLDGVHPSAGGYAKMAAVWYAALRSVPGALGTTPTTTPVTPTTTTTTPPVTTTTSPAPVGRGCAATYRTTNSWGSGFQGEVTVRNSGDAAIGGWSVALALAGGQRVTNLWNGTTSGSSGALAVGNAAYNGALAPGGTTTFGFVADGSPAVSPTIGGCTAA